MYGARWEGHRKGREGCRIINWRPRESESTVRSSRWALPAWEKTTVSFRIHEKTGPAYPPDTYIGSALKILRGSCDPARCDQYVSSPRWDEHQVAGGGSGKNVGGKKHAQRCARHGPVRSKVLPTLHLERRPDIVLSEGSERLLHKD